MNKNCPNANTEHCIKFSPLSKLQYSIAFLAIIPRFQCNESRNFKNDTRLKVLQRSVFLRKTFILQVKGVICFLNRPLEFQNGFTVFET